MSPTPSPEHRLRRVAPRSAHAGAKERTNPASPQQRAIDDLLVRYAACIRSSYGAEVTGYLITVAGGEEELTVDLFDLTRHELVVARASADQGTVLSAFGEVLYVGRFFAPAPGRLVLVPSRPRPDLVELLHETNVTLAWPAGPHAFTRSR
ncbi:hypothetical protein ACPCKW_23625 [Streptomyces griseoincarnatus]